MKKILVIGIGAGDPEHVTVQAINALNMVDVFFVLEKGAAKRGLVALRQEICRRYATGRSYRVLEAPSPKRDAQPADYEACVEGLNQEKQAVFESLIGQMKEGECGAFLAWGDPSLYDSTIRNLDAVAAAGRQSIEVEVIPGISAVQVLAAKHRITLNTVGRPVEITTGRRLREGWPVGADSVVVMLDGEEAYRRFVDEDIEIYWGAYLGTPDEILVAGKLRDVAEEIHQARTAARTAHGWIMDTYLLRKG
ncbi:MAG TPA: precorrin-6A synthase (deacetylating) [Reyranella sp.]|nr:precorrin-6A synthase (deacetylating) [Reyranella sp.]